jgi:CubicO group peptidase (beta-lactamase class C family)
LDINIDGFIGMTKLHSRIRSFLLVFLTIILAALLTFSGCRIIEDKLDNYLNATYKLWGFSGSVLVARNGCVILSKGYGLADKTFNISNNPQTKFFIGSITKQFTAVCIMILKERCILKLDDPIIKYLPEYPRPNGEKITIRHLLTHTSGIPNYTNFPEVLLKRTQPSSTKYLIDLFKKQPLEFEPGSDFKYSNSGYLLLGEIIELVSGQSYEAFLHHEILKPLKMKNSGYARREAAHPDRASGYTGDITEALNKALPVHFSVLHSAGAMYSTVEDILIWDQALYNEKILSKSSIKEMFTPYLGNYGYGWSIETVNGIKHAFHDGFLDGFNTMISRWMDHKLCIIVFSNDDNTPVRKISRGLAAIIYDAPYDFPIKKKPISLDKHYLDSYEGVYSLPDSSCMYITVKENTLYTHLLAQRRIKLLPEAIDTFFYENDNTLNLIFYRDEFRKIVSLVLKDDGGEIYANRLEEDIIRDLTHSRKTIRLKPDIVEQYVGIYRMITSSEISTSSFHLTITRQDTLLIAAVTGTEAIALYPSSETEFFHKEADFELKFDIDDTDTTIRCTLIMGSSKVIGYKIK